MSYPQCILYIFLSLFSFKVSDQGVMARFPFLDENLVSFLCQLDTEIKCCFDYPRGVGEKLILRQDLWNYSIYTIQLSCTELLLRSRDISAGAGLKIRLQLQLR